MFKKYKPIILTEERLKDIVEQKYNKLIESNNKLIESIGLEAFKQGKTTFNIFLSHKHNEEDYINNARKLLEGYNQDVYLDWQDKTMPKRTNAETAEKIKEAIKNSNKFILLASDQAIRSAWCLWELGYGDAMKYPDNIALLPVAKNKDDYKGNEYLRIYPYITEQNNKFYIKYPNQSVTSLENWFKK